MKEIMLMFLCGSLLAVTVKPQVRVCQMLFSEQSRPGCKFPVGGDTFEKSINETLAQRNNTEENSSLNETAAVLKNNETVAEQTKQPLKIRAKRQQEASDDVRDRHPFSSGGSSFASTSDVETEENRLNETDTEMLKANETMVEQTTQPPKPTARPEPQKATVHLSIRHPFSSGGSKFASTQDEEKETAEQTTQSPKIRAKRQPGNGLTSRHPFRSGGSTAEKTTQPPKRRAKRQPGTDLTIGHPFRSGGSTFASKSVDVENTTQVEEKQLNDTDTEMLNGNNTTGEQATQPPKTRAKRHQEECDLKCKHPFGSGDSSFASNNEDVEKTTVEEKQLNETEIETLKGNETMTNQMTPLPTTSAAEM